MSAVNNAAMPRGISNKNPGNIRLTNIVWSGQVTGTDPDYVTFTDPKWGIRAIVKIFRIYQQKWGIRTIGGACARWAPAADDNDTLAYAADVSRRCLVTPDQEVDFEKMWPAIVKAIIWHENGMQPYDDATINKGISLA